LNEWIEVEKLLRSHPLHDIAYLVLLVNALGGSIIPQLTLLRAQLPQRRWNDSSKVQEVPALEAGLDQQLFCGVRKVHLAIFVTGTNEPP